MVYIGKTYKDINDRFREHINDSIRTDRTHCKFHKALKELDLNIFI